MKYFGLLKMPIDTDITNFILKAGRYIPKKRESSLSSGRAQKTQTEWLCFPFLFAVFRHNE